MKCRIDIKGRKIWVDNNNSYNTRPASVDIILSRDGEEHKTVTLDALGDGQYKFLCLPIWKNNTKYVYAVDEVDIPDGYTRTFQGRNIINTLNNITINGTKTWVDEDDAEGLRPADITIRLMQNGTEISSQNVGSPTAPDNTVSFSFTDVPFADAQGVPYAYTVTEDPVDNYSTTINGFNITNTLQIIPFAFIKKSARTAMALEDATFEIRKNGAFISSSVSDKNGTVSFTLFGTGNFQLMETLSPAGYMDNTTVYQVDVSVDGTVTIDGIPASEFIIENQPMAYGLILSRAVLNTAVYNSAPNTWPLHGIGSPDLYMVDKIIISPEITPVMVKWDYGAKTVDYFTSGGGSEITSSYTNGIPVNANGIYTVYALFSSGYQTVTTITVDRIRDGSMAMPYLLIDYATATSLEPSATGIGQFTMNFMQNDEEKLAKNYELYENIDMTGKTWLPLGDNSESGFTGGFNGNGNDIENLSITSSGGTFSNTGLFSLAGAGAVIENLNLKSAVIINTQGNAAGFAGLVYNNNTTTTVLRNLNFFGSVTSSNETAGGIVAQVSIMKGDTLIEKCTFEGNLSGKNGGGIVGYAPIAAGCELDVTNCSTTGSFFATGMTDNNFSGGIAGNARVLSGDGRFIIENCVNEMEIQGKAKSGGIIGTATAFHESKVSSCLNSGEVTGVITAGGIAGEMTCSNSADMITVQNCYNVAKVYIDSVSSASYAGGIIGACNFFVKIQNSYNVGDVTTLAGTQNNVGGIAGMYGQIDNCAAINELCSNSQSNVARISPSMNTAVQSALSNNVAYDNMRVLINGTQKSPLDIGANNQDGDDVTAAAIKIQNLYQSDLGWDFGDVWVFGNVGYTLPILKGIPLSLQPDTIPAHLA